MTTALQLVCGGLTLVLTPFFLYLAILVVAAVLARGRARELGGGASAWRFLFVIPAHDEEANIGATVASCRAVAYDPDRLAVAVIADNCADATARVAREAGALVVERTDDARRSKGHALDFFFEQLRAGAVGGGDWDAVVIVDADTVVVPGLLHDFAAALDGGADWAQGYYTTRNPDASWRTQLVTYAFSLINGVWPLGQDRLGLGVGLKGNGMCFTLTGLARHPWAAHGLAEDQEFGWSLRLAGERVRFRPEARVLGEMVRHGGGPAVSQRQRWEVGRASVRSAVLGPLLRSTALGPGLKAVYLVDLLFPPLVTLLLVLLAASGVHVLAALDPRLALLARALVPVHLAMATALTAYALSPVFVLGLPPRYLASLRFLPRYAAWKMLVALRTKPAGWVRTRREPTTRAE